MFSIKPIAHAYNERKEMTDDNWGKVETKIVLVQDISEDSLAGIESFSHLEVIFYFHRVKKEKIVTEARHPRNNKNLPIVGIFAQRGKNRPNQLGLSTVRLLRREGRDLYVLGLDCIDETPIIDIKPVMKEFLPQGSIVQPTWTNDVMKNYWNK